MGLAGVAPTEPAHDRVRVLDRVVARRPVRLVLAPFGLALGAAVATHAGPGWTVTGLVYAGNAQLAVLEPLHAAAEPATLGRARTAAGTDRGFRGADVLRRRPSRPRASLTHRRGTAAGGVEGLAGAVEECGRLGAPSTGEGGIALGVGEVSPGLEHRRLPRRSFPELQ
jgi:hypothetical protein